MNLGDFMRNLQDELVAPKRDVAIDPFKGLDPMIAEMAQAADLITRRIGDIQISSMRREMSIMHLTSRELQEKVKQLAIMAETLLRVTATHKAMGVK